jgi:hypothetical protein
VELLFLDLPAVAADAVGKGQAADGGIEEGDLVAVDGEVSVRQAGRDPVMLVGDDEQKPFVWAVGNELPSPLQLCRCGAARRHAALRSRRRRGGAGARGR